MFDKGLLEEFPLWHDSVRTAPLQHWLTPLLLKKLGKVVTVSRAAGATHNPFARFRVTDCVRKLTELSLLAPCIRRSIGHIQNASTCVVRRSVISDFGLLDQLVKALVECHEKNPYSKFFGK